MSKTDLVVVIPSRGRPEQAARLAARIHDQGAIDAPVPVVISVDYNDPYRQTYVDLASQMDFDVEFPGHPSARANHVAAINRGVTWAIRAYRPRMVVKMDDDHWPVTYGWHRHYLAALDRLGGTGVVYGNDLFQGESLPTVPGISTNIITELGWFAPPALGHLFCDNFWLELGRQSGRLAYLADTKIEHRHPNAGKAERDPTYNQGGLNDARWRVDQAAWESMNRPGQDPDNLTQMQNWVRRVRALTEGATA